MAILGNGDLYNRIDQLLNKKNMSRRQLAKMIGVPPTTLQSAFEKNSNLSVDRLSKIAKALGVEPSDILGSNWGMVFPLNPPVRDQDNPWKQIELFCDTIEHPLEPEQLEKQLEKRLEKAYCSLSYEGRRVAVERVEELAQLPQYQEKHPAGDSTQSAGTGDEKDPE